MRDDSRPRILVVRPDRIGDVILSTPVFEAIKDRYPNSHLSILVRSVVVPLLKGLPTVDEVLVYDPDHRHAGVRGMLNLTREIRNLQVAFGLQGTWKIGAAVFLAGIPVRVGP